MHPQPYFQFLVNGWTSSDGCARGAEESWTVFGFLCFPCFEFCAVAAFEFARWLRWRRSATHGTSTCSWRQAELLSGDRHVQANPKVTVAREVAHGGDLHMFYHVQGHPGKVKQLAKKQDPSPVC